MDNIKKISFVIPCYNSEKTISGVISDVINTVGTKNDFEIICVNDCSDDNVYMVLQNIAKNDKRIKVINLANNSGQNNALMCGFRNITGDVVVTLDDDGQTDPKQSYKLIDALSYNVDVAIARYKVKKHSRFRNFGTFITRIMMIWLCNIPKNIYITSYYACKRFVIDEVIRYSNKFTFLEGLLVRTTKNVINVDIEHFERKEGKSGYTFLKLISLWLDGFTAFSVKPLRISTCIGFITAFVGFAYGIYIVIEKLINPIEPIGYSSIICSILFIGGMIMLMLGMIGEYIGRMYICINSAPQYVIKEKINFDIDEK